MIDRKLLYVVGGASVLTTAYFINKRVKKNKLLVSNKQTLESSKAEFKKLSDDGEKISFTPGVYSSLVSEIKLLLDGCETFGSEIKVIEKIISVIKKPIDYYYLINLSGVFEVSDCGSFGALKTSYDFISLLKDQLDSAGLYSIKVDGYSATGFTSDSFDILQKYFESIKIKV